MRNIFFVMSFSSTVILLIYYIVNFLFGKFLEVKTKRCILLMATLFGLIPLSYFKYIFFNLVLTILPFLDRDNDHNISYSLKSAVVFFNNHNKIYSIDQKVILFIYAVSIILATIIIFFQIRKYYQLMNIIKRHSVHIDNRENEIFYKIESDLKIKTHIVGVKSSLVSVPMAAGINNPIIILPNDREFVFANLQNVIYHEMVHIKHKDVCVRFLGLLVIAFHWYNPFSYILFYTLSHVNELYSDEVVTLRFNKKQKYDYCYMMLDFLEKNNGEKSHFALSYFVRNNKKQIKERIDRIMNKRKEHRVIGGLICFICLVCGGIATFLYEPPQIVYAQEYEFSNEVGELEFKGNDEENILFSENYFIDKEGNVIELTPSQSKAPCFHRYVDGILKNHLKNNNGSCKTNYYYAQRCTICNALKIGSLYKTETYVKCPH